MPDIGKLPPWAWAIGAVGVGAGLYLYKKDKEAKSLSEVSGMESEPQPYIAGLENPAEEFPYSFGAGGGSGGGAIANAYESQQEFHELFGAQQTFEKELSTEQIESQKSISEQIRQGQESITHVLEQAVKAPSAAIPQGEGGGAPSSGPPGGTTTVKAPAPQSPCPPGWTVNSTGKPGSCYHIKKCGNGCDGHFYKNGTTECQQKTNGKCHW